VTNQPQDIEVEITSVAFGGRGIARHEGKVYFIAGTIPGDRVRARVTEDKERYADAQVVSLLQPSPSRSVPSACPWAKSCGGCVWLEVPPEKQTEWKTSFVQNALDRIGKIPADVKIQPHAAPASLAYRNRIHLKGHALPGEKLRVGYFKVSSHELIPITRCAIAAPIINATVERLSETLSPLESERRFKLEIMELPPSTQRATAEVALTLFPERGEQEALRPLLDFLKSLPSVAWAGFMFETSSAPMFIYDAEDTLAWHTQPGCFLQVNRAHNQTARALVRQWVEDVRPARLLDLYCGNGNLSLGLARDGRYIEGVEVSRQAIAAAKWSSEKLGLHDTLWLATECEKHLWKCAKGGERFDLVITDPPREGMYRELVPLKIMRPKHLIYMSCDPATLARDLASLCKKEYQIREIHAFDFFPNTWHVETLVRLEAS
jgi:23S rRNA (uracil1939-C5)-methyltransferase